jgi:hypothetical protein
MFVSFLIGFHPMRRRQIGCKLIFARFIFGLTLTGVMSRKDSAKKMHEMITTRLYDGPMVVCQSQISGHPAVDGFIAPAQNMI